MELSLLRELKVSKFVFPADKGKMIFPQEKIKDRLSFGEENILNKVPQC